MNEILFWGLSLNAWITLVPADNPNIGKTLGEAGLFHVKGGNLIEIYHFDDVQCPASEEEYIIGGYRFSDFMRIGIPLTLIITFTGIVAACLTFPLTPLQ